jgi:hypothetical protein
VIPDGPVPLWIRIRDALPLRSAMGLAAVGALAFVVAVYYPVWKADPGWWPLEDGLAVAGAVVLIVGTLLAWDIRQYERRGRPRRSLESHADFLKQLGPSVEIYNPGGGGGPLSRTARRVPDTEADDDE